MPKLSATNNPAPQDDRQGKTPAVESKCRPCPRCFVALVLERRYRARGLSGTESLHEIYNCPACDARFQHNVAEARWRDITA